MEEQYTVTAVILDENLSYTRIEVCQKLNISEALLQEMEEQGLFRARIPASSATPQIHLQDLKRLESACHIHRDLDVNVPGVVLVLDLLEELQDLRQRLAILER